MTSKISKLVIVGLLSLSLIAPVSAQTEQSAETAQKKKITEVKGFQRRMVNVTGTVKQITGTKAPSELVILVTAVMPKKNAKWTGAYPATGQELTVLINGAAKLVRHGFTKSSLGEISIGDTVRVTAKTREDGKITVQVLRDLSLVGVVKVGTIESKNDADKSFVLKLPNSDRLLTIVTNDSTKFMTAEKGATTAFSELKVGDKIFARGTVTGRDSAKVNAKVVRQLR